jgi:hypothetical protein
MTGRVENTSAPLVRIAQDPRSIFDKLFIANPLPCDVSVHTLCKSLAAFLWPISQDHVTFPEYP